MILTEEIENSLKNEAEIDDLLKQIHISIIYLKNTI